MIKGYKSFSCQKCLKWQTVQSVHSREGTTQGDPLAMSIYGIAILPLIQKLQGLYRQLWFADDASAGGKITQLKDWWTRMQGLGPLFGYHPNPSKTWLLTKDHHLETAKEGGLWGLQHMHPIHGSEAPWLSLGEWLFPKGLCGHEDILLGGQTGEPLRGGKSNHRLRMLRWHIGW